jgi:hypothetical protein
MDVLFSFEAAKASVELISALAKLSQEAKESEKGSVHEVITNLKADAIRIAIGLGHNLEGLRRTFKQLDVNLSKTLQEAEEDISGWHQLKKAQFRAAGKRLELIASGLKDFYTDVERIYTCNKIQEKLIEGVKRAYEVRQEISKAMASGSIGDLLNHMQEAAEQARKMLES